MNRTTPHLRILVVDGAQSMAQALSVILIENGYDASPVNSAAEVLELCRLSRPDVVIIGALPGPMDGTQLAMQIVTGHPECKVLRISDDVFPLGQSKYPSRADDGIRVPGRPINSRAILTYLDTI
jgi:CheY-like chemotaxis protein